MVESLVETKADAQVERFYECAVLILKQAQYKGFAPGELWVALKIVRYVLEHEQGVFFPADVEHQIDKQVAGSTVLHAQATGSPRGAYR